MEIICLSMGDIISSNNTCFILRRVSVLVIFYFLFVFFPNQSPAQPLWEWQNPYPQGSDINAVFFADSLHGYTVGVYGTINRTADGGESWNHCKSGVLLDLTGVFFNNATTGTAVGLGGIILRTTDGGLTWLPQSSGTTTALKAVAFPTINTGTAVGLFGTILRTTNAGATWVLQTSGMTEHLFGVSFADANIGTAVGFNGTIIRTTNGGTTWVPQVGGTANHLYRVDFSDANTGTAVGLNGTILRTTDGGTSWSPRTSGTANHLYGVSFSGADTGVVTGNNGTVLYTIDGGSTWTPAPSGTMNAIYNTVLTDINNGWAVGAWGTLLHTSNGGVSWFSQIRGTRQHLHGVDFADSLNGFAVGDSGTLLETTDGGNTWLSYYSGTLLNLADVEASDANHAIAVGQGGLILRTTDGGITWDVRPSGITTQINSLAYPTIDIAVAVAKEGYFLKTTNGGDSWHFQQTFRGETQNRISMLDAWRGVTIATPSFWRRSDNGFDTIPYPDHMKEWPYKQNNDIILLSGDTAIAVGASGWIIRSTQVFSGPTQFNFSGVDSPTDKTLKAIDFINMGTGIVVGENGAIIRTTDGGITWTGGESSGTGDHLNDVKYLDTNHIWAVGDQGTILRYTPPVVDTIQRFEVHDKWNMVSVPYGVGDYSATTLFPAAVSSAFGFENGYVAYDTLENGRGYWLKFPKAQSVVMNGTPLEAETVAVAVDWNMVGSLSSPVDVATISSIPGGIVTSGFYQFAGSYQQSTVILPGKGYWVKCSQPGQLVFSSAGNTPAASRIRIKDGGETPPSPPDEHQAQGMSMPLIYSLSQNTPNPFNPTTQISYTIPIRSKVTLKVYNVLGQLVTTLADEILSPGEHTVLWDAGGLPSGVYFYRIVSGPYTHTLKMVVMK